MKTKPAIDEFVRPNPNPKLIDRLVPVNRYLMLKGLPILRDLPGLRKIPGLRGLCNVRHLDFPEADRERLAGVCGAGKVTFLVPNHPEFFTDWMLDKHVISKCCKKTACWATHGVVNGLGRLAQKFWLANNLIAQIPGNTEPSRRHSIDWALKGHGVLLHPEGMVGWHSNHIGKLFPGAFDMARQAMQEAKEEGREVDAYVAPIVWKLVFNGNVTDGLARECKYIENKLKISGGAEIDQIEKRVFYIFCQLLDRDIEKWQVKTKDDATYRARQQALIKTVSRQLADLIGFDHENPAEGCLVDCDPLQRAARKWLRENRKHTSEKQVKKLLNVLARHACLGDFAYASKTITQEELAEHLKRIRRDYCTGSIWDVLNAYFPQAAGPRTAYVRVPKAFGLHTKEDATAGVDDLRSRMQDMLDEINANIKKQNGFIWYPNPFLL